MLHGVLTGGMGTLKDRARLIGRHKTFLNGVWLPAGDVGVELAPQTDVYVYMRDGV